MMDVSDFVDSRDLFSDWISIEVEIAEYYFEQVELHSETFYIYSEYFDIIIPAEGKGEIYHFNKRGDEEIFMKDGREPEWWKFINKIVYDYAVKKDKKYETIFQEFKDKRNYSWFVLDNNILSVYSHMIQGNISKRESYLVKISINTCVQKNNLKKLSTLCFLKDQNSKTGKFNLYFNALSRYPTIHHSSNDEDNIYFEVTLEELNKGYVVRDYDELYEEEEIELLSYDSSEIDL